METRNTAFNTERTEHNRDDQSDGNVDEQQTDARASTDGKVFDLQFGIEVDGFIYDQIHLRRAKAKDRRAMAKIEDVTEQQATLIANLASIPEGPSTIPLNAIDEMDMADYTLLSSYVNQNFFGLKPAS